VRLLDSTPARTVDGGKLLKNVAQRQDIGDVLGNSLVKLEVAGRAQAFSALEVT
jgi:hypothetical protein